MLTTSLAVLTGAAPGLAHQRACPDGCTHGCGVHGHNHRVAWTAPPPTADGAQSTFRGALGRSCFAA